MKTPTLLKYPKFLDKQHLNNVRDVLCYLIEDYGLTGVSVLLSRDKSKDRVVVLIGDWDGNLIDIKNPVGITKEECDTILSKYVPDMINIMNLTRVDQAQYYMDSRLRLVDVQVSVNKFVGPGMLRDVFSRTFAIPEVLAIKQLDADSILSLQNDNKHIVAKPSRFRLFEADKTYTPLYIRT